ncbi:MAG: helicase-exonuclease AddAB subunit AddA [Clostridia bacterium]|nr:helicase-exonuclease AddAB subunit AddA [Clostridia bacterium]
MGVNWTQDQRKAIDSRNGTLLVSAAAGSGKTAVLVERLLKFVIEEGYDIDKFLMITFTNAAASELRAKIVDALSDKIATNPENRHLARQMNIVHRASISTIHAYCMQVLRSHGHYLGITSDFKIIDEGEGDILRRQVLEDLLEERYEKGDSDFMQMCAALAGRRDDLDMAENILKIHSKSRSHPNPKKWLSDCVSMYEENSDIWEREIAAYITEYCGHLVKKIDAVIAEIKIDPVIDAAYSGTLANDRQWLLSFTGDKTFAELYESAGKVDFLNLGSTRGCENPELREWAKDERGAVKDRLSKLCSKYLCKSPERFREEISKLAPVVREICDIVGELDDRFTAKKIERSAMDYSDLEHAAVKLLVESYDEKEDRVYPTPLAVELSDDFCEIMVDEYQDTNCIQDIIFRAISKDEKNITMVGDLKQSIYRFRLADPTIFLAKYKAFKDYDKARDGEPRVVNLAKNFRSREEVLDTCNKYFSLTMTERLGELNYTTREYLNPRDEIPESTMNCESELVVIDLDEKGRNDELPGTRDTEAKYIAARIKQMHEEGTPYEDFVILLRSQVGRAPIYENALREYGIPCVSEKKAGILGTVEISTIVSFLQIIDNPLWDIPLVAVLRSPLFAFTADDLACVRRYKRGAFYHALEECAKSESDISERVKEFLKILSEFRDMANETGTDELIWHILDSTGARGLFGAMHGGEFRIGNLHEFYNYAVRFESQGFKGLHAFLNHIAYITDRGGDIAGDNTESSGGAVKIMSIHKSKGLEFPIVFLVDGNRKFNEKDLSEQIIVHPKFGLGLNFRDNELGYECPTIAKNCIALQLKNEMKSEELRVLYVAMTRAKEKLIVMCTERNATRRLSLAENTVIGGDVSPIDLLNSANIDMWFLLPQAADNSIFEMKIVKDDEIAPPDTADEFIGDSAEFDEWRVEELKRRFAFEYPYEKAVNTEGKLTATGIAHESVSVHRHFKRPRFIQKTGLTASEKGIAIHLVMQFIDFEKCVDRASVEKEIDRLYEEEYLTREQYEVIPAGKIFAFFESELGKLVRGNNCRREFNFSRLVSVSDEDSALLQGVVDLMIEMPEGIVIVDFKSDSTINENNVAQYMRQLLVYKESLEIILKKPVCDCYLYFIQHEKIIKSEK